MNLAKDSRQQNHLKLLSADTAPSIWQGSGVVFCWGQLEVFLGTLPCRR